MPKRPYIKFRIYELETLFENSKTDAQVRELLLAELKHRKTRRALNLKAKVEVLQKVKKVEPVRAETSSSEPEPLQPPTSEPSSTKRVEPETLREPEPPFAPPIPVFVSDRQEHTKVTSSSDAVLAAWLAQEILTPQKLPTPRSLSAVRQRLIRLDEEAEPWLNPAYKRKGREKAVYWMIYLAELNLAQMTEALLQIFPDELREERASTRGTVAAAVVVLDAEGVPVEEKLFLASFPWGYGMTLKGRLKELTSFHLAERTLLQALDKITTVLDDEEVVQPLTVLTIKRAVAWLMYALQLPARDLVSSGIAVRVPVYSRFPEAPEPELLNSFYLNDLTRIREEMHVKNAGLGSQAYLAASPSEPRHDVYKRTDKLNEVLAPEKTPLSRWPTAGGFPLVMMQQAAVNHAARELAEEGLVAVNGPPGTGKTTLLRDIIAKVVLDRALAMAEFEKPADAFSHVGSMKTGQAFTHLYQLDTRLLGHEIVVASSNNKAVENISREIPAVDAIANTFEPPLRYFQSVSDAVAAAGEELEDGATWGLAAAVLGNKANRNRFINDFWWHKKRGMFYYLKAVTGDNPFLSLDPKTLSEELQEMVDVVTLEQPPESEIEAQQRYRKSRAEFRTKYERALGLQNQIQAVYEAVQEEYRLIEAVKKLNQEVQEVQDTRRHYQERLVEAEQGAARANLHEARVTGDRDAQQALRPGFLTRIFRRRQYQTWSVYLQELIQGVREARQSTEAAQAQLTQLQVTVKQLDEARTKLLAQRAEVEQQLNQNQETIARGRASLGSNLADRDFWAQTDEVKQLASPWLSPEWQAARNDLFAASFNLHRAFIDASAKYLRHNIMAALEQLKGRSLSSSQAPARRSLWASLFLVVPVISTTFASVSNLFQSLGREEIGWLLIDEAGQALPQAAVGAIWRAKRSVVIGDPLQIQPVVTTSPKLVGAIHAAYAVEAQQWAAPLVSAQSLADRNSWFGTELESNGGSIWVGSPLRVHRRCEEPMFSISNYIAYNNQMVYGTAPQNSVIGQVLGNSYWLHLESQGSGKWSEEEGRAAAKLLEKLDAAGIDEADIFFVSPFRNVADNLRNQLRSTGRDYSWANDRVGTIHTFQGKEAEVVVLVLGAPNVNSFGARNWAGETVNILNVAVTRAKRHIYVIGNRDLWKQAGVFTHLAQNLPVIENRNVK